MRFVYLSQAELLLKLARLCGQLLNLRLEKRFLLFIALDPSFPIFQLEPDLLELEVLLLRCFLGLCELVTQLLNRFLQLELFTLFFLQVLDFNVKFLIVLLAE